jgi:siroheme synthase-like protein
MPGYYPVFLNLSGKPVMIAGAGKVALRKARGLVEAGAKVTVVAPEIHPDFETLPVVLKRRKWRASDLRNAVLVFAATNDREINHKISQAALRLRIPANIADDRSECGFIVPARITRGNIQIAISTSGSSPRLTAALRRKIEENL